MDPYVYTDPDDDLRAKMVARLGDLINSATLLPDGDAEQIARALVEAGVTLPDATGNGGEAR